MTNTYSLADLKNDLDKKFAPVKFDVDGETLTLQNLMRVNDKSRNEALAALEVVQSLTAQDEGEQDAEAVSKLSEAIATVLRTVTANGKGEKLVKMVDGDLVLALKVIELWVEATQPGEAGNSST